MRGRTRNPKSGIWNPRLARATLPLAGLVFCAGLPAAAPAQNATLALAELVEIRDAQLQCLTLGNFYTTIENLNDNFNDDSFLEFDYINDGGGAWIVPPATALPVRQFLPEGFLGTPNTWQGPFLNYQPSRISGPDGDYEEGTLLDLNGALPEQPYYMYTPLGLLDPEAAGGLSLRYYGDAFDQYAVVSHGPDGQAQTPDDLVVSFGTAPTVATVSSARFRAPDTRRRAGPAALQSDWELRIRGYNLGSEATGSAAVLADGVPLAGASAQEWTATQVVLLVPETALEDGDLVAIRTPGGTETRSVAVVVEQEPTAAPQWVLY